MRAFAAALLLAGAPAFAFAQQTPPPSPPPAPQTSAPPILVVRPVSGFVVDARGMLAKFGQRRTLATAFDVRASDLPGPGIGGTIGAHVYPVRLRRVAFGIGAELSVARRSRQPLDDAGKPKGPILKAQVFSIAPQVSLNFGHRNGWSFVSAGIGRASFETWPETSENPDRRVRSINYGGGARWFTSPHLAFIIDLRFHAIAPGLADGDLIERPRQRLMMLSAGISIR